MSEQVEDSSKIPAEAAAAHDIAEAVANAEETSTSAAKRANEEEQSETKRQKPSIPDGMSKNAWKKLQRQKRWEETKVQFRQDQRAKRKLNKQKRKEQEPTDDANYHSAKKNRVLPESQKPTGVEFIMDCGFDSLMNGKEIASLSNQIARCYSTKRRCEYDVGMQISSVNGNLKERFTNAVQQYKSWKNFPMHENEDLADLIDESKKDKYIYLTADTDEVLETLESGYTYIIGGIVDKNRHKNICVNKAKELGLKVGRLPIDKYIQMNSRHVLATSHVYEICCKWFEHDKSWKQAFDEVLPARKIHPKTKPSQTSQTTSQTTDQTTNQTDQITDQTDQTTDQTDQTTDKTTDQTTDQTSQTGDQTAGTSHD